MVNLLTPALLIELEYAPRISPSAGLSQTLDSHHNDHVVLDLQINQGSVGELEPRPVVNAFGAALCDAINLVRRIPEAQHEVLSGRHQPKDEAAEIFRHFFFAFGKHAGQFCPSGRIKCIQQLDDHVKNVLASMAADHGYGTD